MILRLYSSLSWSVWTSGERKRGLASCNRKLKVLLVWTAYCKSLLNSVWRITSRLWSIIWSYNWPLAISSNKVVRNRIWKLKLVVLNIDKKIFLSYHRIIILLLLVVKVVIHRSLLKVILVVKIHHSSVLLRLFIKVINRRNLLMKYCKHFEKITLDMRLLWDDEWFYWGALVTWEELFETD